MQLTRSIPIPTKETHNTMSKETQAAIDAAVAAALEDVANRVIKEVIAALRRYLSQRDIARVHLESLEDFEWTEEEALVDPQLFAVFKLPGSVWHAEKPTHPWVGLCGAKPVRQEGDRIEEGVSWWAANRYDKCATCAERLNYSDTALALAYRRATLTRGGTTVTSGFDAS